MIVYLTEGFSDNLAGITLIALGSCSPDLFSVISASGTGPSGVLISCSLLLGSSSFLLSCGTSLIHLYYDDNYKVRLLVSVAA